MARRLKGYEVFGGLGLAGIAVFWLAYSLSTDSSKVAPPSASVESPGRSRPLTIRSGAVICFSRDSWESFKMAIADNQLTRLKSLFDTGNCQRIVKPLAARYFAPVEGEAARVQTQGGRGAFVSIRDTE